MQTPTHTEMVFNHNGQPMTDSYLVAEKFGKNHKDILKKIRSFIGEVDNDFLGRNFALQLKTRQLYTGGNINEHYYLLTRDGFSFLVMGFTGKEANKFKVKFINAFNQMEKALIEASKPQTMLDYAKAFVASEEARLALEEKNKALLETNEKLSEKASYVTRISSSNGTFAMSEIAKVLQLGYGRNILYQKLRDKGIFFNDRNEPKQCFVNQGYFELKAKVIPIGHYDDGKEITKLITISRVTPKGMLFLARNFDAKEYLTKNTKDLTKI